MVNLVFILILRYISNDVIERNALSLENSIEA